MVCWNHMLYKSLSSRVKNEEREEKTGDACENDLDCSRSCYKWWWVNSLIGA